MSYKGKVLLAILLSFLIIGLVKAENKSLTTKQVVEQSCNWEVDGYKTAILFYNGDFVVTKMRKISNGYYKTMDGKFIVVIKIGSLSVLCSPNLYNVLKIFSKSGNRFNEVGVLQGV